MPAKKEKKTETISGVIEKRFLSERKLFLWGAIEDSSAQQVTSKLFYLEMENPGKEITIYLNTPGGSITAGMAIYDTMQLISSPVNVVVTGMAASMGSIILSGAKRGRRYIFPHAKVMIHQPLIMGQIFAPAVDINIQAAEMEKLRDLLNDILAKASGQSIERIKTDTDRDFYLDAQASIEYGLADKIVDKFF